MRRNISLKKPYFMENTEWYRFDEKNWKYILTDKAPSKAVRSYKEYYKELGYNAN